MVVADGRWQLDSNDNILAFKLADLRRGETSVSTKKKWAAELRSTPYEYTDDDRTALKHICESHWSLLIQQTSSGARYIRKPF